jgi:hypothetical protein
MPYTYSKLRGRIIEKFGTLGNFAEAIGLSRVSVSNKMQCKAGFSQEDIELWSSKLDIDNKDIGSFYFT